MSRALITGGAGFIGSHLAEALLQRGDDVTLLDNLVDQVHPGGVTPDYLPASARLVVADLLDRETLAAVIADRDVVYHLASETGTGQSMYEPARYVRTNVEGTAALLEVIQAHPRATRPRLVLAASRSVYGEGAAVCAVCGPVHPDTRDAAALAAGRWEPRCPRCRQKVTSQPTREDAPLRPSSVYGVSKLAQEEVLRVAGEAGACDVWALRLQNVYGERQSLSNPYTGLLAVFANRLRRGLSCELFEDGESTRDFIHVGDVVSALVAAGERPAGGYRVVNIGSGVPTTVRTVARRLRQNVAGSAAAVNAPESVVTGVFRAGDVRHAIADIERARSLLDWRPMTSFEDGIRRFVQWACATPLPEERSGEALTELRRRGLGG